MTAKTILSLGDSYTIGELVEEEKNFPNQLQQLLQQHGYDYAKPKIIAVTGWTTDELRKAIDENSISKKYDLVTLLIGVNNQYRGRSIENFKIEFRDLLVKAIDFSKDRNVYVLSIPDWGCTPFATGKDRVKIAQEIDAFNQSKEEICRKLQIPYIDITIQSRQISSHLLCSDQLHYSDKMYSIWAQEIYNALLKFNHL